MTNSKTDITFYGIDLSNELIKSKISELIKLFKGESIGPVTMSNFIS